MAKQKEQVMLLQILEMTRIIGVGAAFFFGYQIGFAKGYDPIAQLHVMIPVTIVAIAGTSGLEGFFCAKKSAELKGFEVGSNYQKQSAFALLSYAIVACMVYICNWGIQSELTILFAFIFFFFCSSINHGVDAYRRRNYRWQNINRPVLTVLLIIGFVFPITQALQYL